MVGYGRDPANCKVMFLISFLIGNTITRRTIAEIADGLGPALRRRGLTRDRYEHACFRDNLLAF